MHYGIDTLKAKLRLFPLTLLLSLALSLAACTTNPVTGKSQFSLISSQQAIQMGAQQYGPTQQSQGGRYTVDPELGVYVNQVGQKLARVSDRPELPYEFVVLNSDQPNAWALPGGKIAINRGLLVKLEDEAQLASVLGHEIVHAAAGHSAQQMSQSMVLGLGTQLAGIAGGEQYGQLIGMGAQMGSAMVQARYGREQELESDRYGMEYMVRAGYEPQAAVELQRTFVKLSEDRQSNWLDGLFASHPPSQQRVEANRAYAAQLPSGTRNAAAYQRAIAPLKRDQAAYELHQQATKAANNQQMDEAMSLVQRAIRAQPREPLFYATRGQLQMSDKQYQAARGSFDQAHKLYPEYFLPLLGRGLAAHALKSWQQAEQDLLASSKLLPTQSAMFYLGEIKLQQGDKAAAIGYFEQSAQGSGELAERSRSYLQQLNPPPAQSQPAD